MRRTGKMRTESFRELCGVKKWVNERNYEVLKWFVDMQGKYDYRPAC